MFIFISSDSDSSDSISSDSSDSDFFVSVLLSTVKKLNIYSIQDF